MRNLDAFETARLTAERLRPAHFDLLDRHRDPEVMATLAGMLSADETRRFLKDNLDHWQRHGHGLWMFFAKADGQFVGRGGLRHVYAGGNHEVELAYALRAEHWGQGFATEMAAAMLEIGFEELRRADIVSFTLFDNLASRRVMEKAGLCYERDFTHADLPHVLYRLTAADWRQSRPDRIAAQKKA